MFLKVLKQFICFQVFTKISSMKGLKTRSLKMTRVCEDPSPGKMCESPISKMSNNEITNPTSAHKNDNTFNKIILKPILLRMKTNIVFFK